MYRHERLETIRTYMSVRIDREKLIRIFEEELENEIRRLAREYARVLFWLEILHQKCDQSRLTYAHSTANTHV